MAFVSEHTPLVLGSASPRRRELLSQVEVPLRVVPGAAEESIEDGELPRAYLERVVNEKLVSVASRLDESPIAGVLVADTVVVLGETILGKPRDSKEAEQLVGQLVGRAHAVYTRYAIATAEAPNRIARARTVETRVVMRAAERSEVAWYAATGEGLDKAGAYAVQGIASMFVERIEGSYTNVVGLPVCEVMVDLYELGLWGGRS